MKKSTFASLGDDSVAGLIKTATSRIVFAAPNVSSTIATAILEVAESRRNLKIRVIVDVDPEVFRLGFGDFSGFSALFEGGVDIQRAIRLRIGVLIIDDLAWVFSPTPEVILDQPDQSVLNGIAVTANFAGQLLFSVAPDICTGAVTQDVSSDDADPLQDLPIPEITARPVTIDQIKSIEKELTVAPPQQFDMSRRVNVYKAYYQFVEIELSNCNIGAFTIPITEQLLAIVSDSEVRRRLTAKYKLVDANSKVKKDLEGVRDAVRDLRADFTIMINEKLGRVIPTERKKDFIAHKEIISEFISNSTAAMKLELTKEVSDNCERLAQVLLPMVKESPPRYLYNRLLGDLSDDKKILKVIVGALMPKEHDIDKIITGMKLEVVFKDITYEMLTDPDLVEKIRALQPGKEHIFEEGAAIEEKQDVTRTTAIATQNNLIN